MKKNILFVINTLTTGGANSSLSALYAEMARYYDIKVFAISHDGNKDEHGFSDVLLPKNWAADAFYADFAKATGRDKTCKFVVKLLKRICILLHIALEKKIFKHTVKQIEKSYNFDKVIAFQEEASALLCSYFKCEEKLAWVHCDFTKGFPNNDASIYKHFKKVIFVSDYTQTQFLNKYPHLKGKTEYLYNFLNKSRILQLADDEIRDVDLTDNKFTILSLGRIVPLKRFSVIPKIVYEIKAKGGNIRWIILGPIFDKEEYNKLASNILKYGLEKDVLWLGGKENPYPYMKHSDVCVSLSTTEACPMVFNEARVLGVPIVSTNFGSAHEFINNGVDGYVCSIERIPDVLFSLYSNRENYKYIKSNSSIQYINNNDIVNKLLSIIN